MVMMSGAVLPLGRPKPEPGIPPGPLYRLGGKVQVFGSFFRYFHRFINREVDYKPSIQDLNYTFMKC